MPVFEEKLISPFAIRFSQEHIKTTFRDGRVVEDTIGEIGSTAGVNDFELILDAPFPHIEIARWEPKGPDRDGEHWFTLDNRRLYALQRAAAAHWPKTVAVVVQILYDDAGHLWKKYDSSTYGRSVSIAHRLKSAEICRWDWYREFLARDLGTEMLPTARAVLADDDKSLVDELVDTPAAPGSLMALARKLGPDDGNSAASSSSKSSTPRISDDSVVLSVLASRCVASERKSSVDHEDTDAGSTHTSSSCSESDDASSAEVLGDATRSGLEHYGSYGTYGAYAEHVGYGSMAQLGCGYGALDYAGSVYAMQVQAQAHVHAQLMEAQRMRMQMIGQYSAMQAYAMERARYARATAQHRRKKAMPR